MKTRVIAVENLAQLAVEDFEQYGQIIGLQMGKPLEDFLHLKYWTRHVDIGPDNEKLDMGLLVCYKSPGLVRMESHPHTREIFIPLEGKSILIVAPPDRDQYGPDLQKLRAFYLDGTLGIALHKETWHRPPWPVGDNNARFALLRKGELTDPTELTELGLKLNLTGVVRTPTELVV